MATSPPGLNHIRARLISVRRPCLAGDRSAHVTIGAAYKVESALDHYFILCREP